MKNFACTPSQENNKVEGEVGVKLIRRLIRIGGCRYTHTHGASVLSIYLCSVFKYSDLTRKELQIMTGNPVIAMKLMSEGSILAKALRSGGYPESIAHNPSRFLKPGYFLNSVNTYLAGNPQQIEKFVSYVALGIKATKSPGLPDHMRRLYFIKAVCTLKGYR